MKWVSTADMGDLWSNYTADIGTDYILMIWELMKQEDKTDMGDGK